MIKTKNKLNTLQILTKVVHLLLLANFGKQRHLKEVLASIGKWPPYKISVRGAENLFA